jgi:glycosyltransferase involved in cell wall biosynthesis
MHVAVLYIPPRTRGRSGEDIAASSQISSLRALGYTTEALDDEGPGLGFAQRRRRILQALESTTADVVHVQRMFPYVMAGDLDRCRVPVVMTIHNFMPLCPAGSASRNLAPCFACAARPSLKLIKDRCYKGSRSQSAILYAQARRPEFGVRNLSQLAHVVSPSERAWEHFRPHLSPTPRHTVVPSFVADLGAPADLSSRRGWSFVGALEPYKGVAQVVARWDASLGPLTIVGSGSLYETLAVGAGPQISFTGQLPRDEATALIRSSIGLVFASSTPETQGLVVAEAASAGTPVLALRGSAGADFVSQHALGVVVDSMSDLHEAKSSIEMNWHTYSAAARRAFQAELTERRWQERMSAVFESAVH